LALQAIVVKLNVSGGNGRTVRAPVRAVSVLNIFLALREVVLKLYESFMTAL
jgi:hypothetical protein